VLLLGEKRRITRNDFGCVTHEKEEEEEKMIEEKKQ
jgi:hypothetical protein